MAATFDVVRRTGASGSITDTVITTTTTRASQSDSPTPGSANAVPIPSSPGTNYSDWFTVRSKATTTPAGTIDTLRYFADGVALPAGVSLNGRDAATGADAGYRQATSAIVLNTTNHTGLDGAPVDVIATYTSAAPLTLVGSITNPSTGLFGDHVVLQYAVTDAATPAEIADTTHTIRYSET